MAVVKTETNPCIPQNQLVNLPNPGNTFCIIENLLEVSFSSRCYSEQVEIIGKDRPRPELPELKSLHKDRSHNFMRHFRLSQYEKVPWLTGSKKLKKLFCWPCLLFNSQRTVWTKEGFYNLNAISNATQKHEKSRKHIEAFLEMKSFDRTRIDFRLEEQQRQEVSRHNQMVKKNREILKRLIDAACLIAQHFQIPFLGNDEVSHSANRENFVEFLHVLSTYDPLLATYLETTTTFKETSYKIQNDVIQAIYGVLINAIKIELKDAPFVAITVDETSDVMNSSQLSTVFRYVNDDGVVQERFLCFVDINTAKTASRLLEHVTAMVNEYDIGKKLIAHCYDGAAVMPGHFSDLCDLVNERYPKAVFVHSYGHTLNLALQQSLCSMKECRVFFQTLTGLAEFFLKFPESKLALDEFVEAKMPPQWNLSSELMQNTFTYRAAFLVLFEKILANSGDWESHDVVQVQGFKSFLCDFQNYFLLIVFARIFRFTGELCKTIQQNGTSIERCRTKLSEVESMLENYRNEFEDVWKEALQEIDPCHPAKRPRREEDLKAENKYLYSQIIDNVRSHLSTRLSTLRELEFFNLLNPKKYSYYGRSHFPDVEFNNLKKTFKNLFDFNRLKNELLVTYTSEEFKGMHPYKLVRYMGVNKLHAGMPEMYKLASLILTIPSSKAFVDQTISAQKRIKSYCRATQGKKRSSALALLSIEKQLLKELKEKSTFYDDVILKFTQQQRRMEFTFK